MYVEHHSTTGWEVMLLLFDPKKEIEEEKKREGEREREGGRE